MKYFGTILTLVFAVSAQANVVTGTDTIATFDDPALDATTPLITYDAGSNTLSGAWNSIGLTLETVSGDYIDATFTLTALPGGLPGEVGAGEVQFFDSLANPIFNIAFDSGQLNAIGFGATEFLSLNDVTFTGSILIDPVQNESFAFSFANQTPVGNDGSFTATAAFTSSATVIPEPATLGLLALGAVAFFRKR